MIGVANIGESHDATGELLVFHQTSLEPVTTAGDAALGIVGVQRSTANAEEVHAAGLRIGSIAGQPKVDSCITGVGRTKVLVKSTRAAIGVELIFRLQR